MTALHSHSMTTMTTATHCSHTTATAVHHSRATTTETHVIPRHDHTNTLKPHHDHSNVSQPYHDHSKTPRPHHYHINIIQNIPRAQHHYRGHNMVTGTHQRAHCNTPVQQKPRQSTKAPARPQQKPCHNRSNPS